MRKLNYFLLLSVVLLLLIGCSKTDTQTTDALKSSDDVTLKKADKFKPFHATFEVYIDLSSIIFKCPNPPCPPNPFNPDFPVPPSWYEGNITFLKYQIVYGEGNVTHLGNTEVEIEQWWRPIPHEEGEVKRGTGCGEIYFTAANGDVLRANYNEALAIHYAVPPPYHVLTTLTGNFINGGTGRFENAEGEFLWEVYYLPGTNFGTITVTGEIMYSK